MRKTELPLFEKNIKQVFTSFRMKNILLILSFSSSQLIFAQKLATTFHDATTNKGIVFEKLDSLYPSALHDDPAIAAAFRGRENEFIEAYQSLLSDLAKYLNQNQFFWDEPTRSFQRIYFNPDGEIDYYFFNFKPGTLNKEKEELFEKLVSEFIRTYHFPLHAASNFAQCSPVVYKNAITINETNKPAAKPDVLPEFPGGRKALAKYIDGKNHHYPKEARKNKIEGKVIVEFMILEDGTPTDFKVAEGIGYGCDEAALEAFKKMPRWKPAMLNGEPVKYTLRMAYLYRL